MRQVCIAILVFMGGLLPATQSRADTDLSEIELKWLNAAEPVLAFAREQGLSIDVVVTPQSHPGDVPLSMGVRDNRCKLVLSMRGNAEAEATLAGISIDRHALLIEAMTAHEIAHCWRYTQSAWHTLPASFAESAEAIENKELRARKREMRATQREEGYADLVALAWTSRQHPEAYTEVHDWLASVRRLQPISGSYHDTRIWLALAADRTAFSPVDSPFEQVQDLWEKGLLRDE